MQFDYDTTAADPKDARSTPKPVPKGNYHIRIAKVETREAKAGLKGKPGKQVEVEAHEYLSLTVEVDGDMHEDYGGRKIFDMLFLEYPDRPDHEPTDMMRRQARASLSAICQACDIKVKNSDELLGLSLMAEVGIGKDQNGDERNEIRRYFSEKELKEGGGKTGGSGGGSTTKPKW